MQERSRLVLVAIKKAFTDIVEELPVSHIMRFKSLALLAFFSLFLFTSYKGEAQTGKTETQVVQSFMRFLAGQNGRHNRVDKNMLPWNLSDVYVNDSLWAKVNISDESRLAARQGLHGAGPQLKMDYRLAKPEFELIKNRMRGQRRTEWTTQDFPENIVVLQQLGLAPAAYYAYSYPIVLLSKKLVLVRRYFHASNVYNRWSCLEAYRIDKAGKFTFENCYLRTYAM